MSTGISFNCTTFNLPVCVWSQLSLSKSSEVWWNAVLKGEKEIDINQINRERSMASVDEEEHAVLDRLTFDYHQKLQGKPQSHEMVRTQTYRPGWARKKSSVWRVVGPLVTTVVQANSCFLCLCLFFSGLLTEIWVTVNSIIWFGLRQDFMSKPWMHKKMVEKSPKSKRHFPLFISN